MARDAITNPDILKGAFKYLGYDARRATFSTWPYEDSVNCNAENLARAGFIKTDYASAICVFCECELEWDDATDDPFEEHKNHSPECPFLPFMKTPEINWKISDDLCKVLAAQAALAHMKPVREYIDVCDVAYKKAVSKVTPYVPEESESED